MKMIGSYLFKGIFCFTLCTGLLACKKANPKTDQLKALSGFAVTTKAVALQGTNPSAFSGTCTKIYDKIQVSLDAGQSWVNLSSMDSSQITKCSDGGTFSASLVSTNSNLSTPLTVSPSIKLLVRASGEFGVSNIDDALITFSTTSSAPGKSVTSGYSVGTNGSTNIRGHVINNAVSLSTNSAGYVLKGRLSK